MIRMQSARRRTLVAAGVLAAAGVVLLSAIAFAGRPDPGSAAAGTGVACPAGGQPAAQMHAWQLRRAVRCLINEERAARDLGAVVRDQSLKEAAQAHSEVMVETGCLAHQCTGEDDLGTRLRDVGYLDGAEMWRFAENTGCGVSAEAMVANWMATRFHRTNILQPKFRDVGIGAVPERVKGHCQRGYATFAVVFGWRDAGGASSATG
jgi:uncharacterized protein YkwD